MFPSFTGSSRKTRNVNLSGQRAENPFTSTGWSSGSPVGASRTVAQAQASRHQRHQEREKIKAVQRLQRAWRGHRVRRQLQDLRRQLLDQLYSGQEQGQDDVVGRLTQALPLVLVVYRASNVQDQQRLALVVQDLVQTNFCAFSSDDISRFRMRRLVRITVATLEMYVLTTSPLQRAAPRY
jgi:ubiquitin-protein ligase E3 C